MNRLPIEKRIQIINFLVEGMSIREISQVSDVSINTVTKLLKETGAACNEFQDKNIRGLNCKCVQCDEIWAFSYAKENSVASEHKGELGYGDIYAWTALDADTKLIVSYVVGKRDADYANLFMQDVTERITNSVELTTIDHRQCLQAVENSFGAGIDYAMLVQFYGSVSLGDQHRYSPSDFVSAKTRTISGNSEAEKESTSFVERQKLNMRMSMRRFTRLTNDFSKKIENLEHAVSVHFMHYNYCRIHQTLRVTPAMEMGLTDHVWSLEELANLIPELVAKKRGSYKSRIAN
jgi:IS1 family transposase